MTLLTTELLGTKTYAAQTVRQMLAQGGGGLQEGAVGATDFKVAQRGAGANMSVDVASGGAWVQGDDATRQGLYHQTNDATINVGVTAAHASLPGLTKSCCRSTIRR